MKLRLTLLFLVFAFVLSCAPKYGNNWQKISEGGFSIMMPAQPTKIRKENATTFKLKQNNETYIVAYNLMTTPDENKIEQALDLVRNGFVSDENDTLKDEKRIKINGFAGREIVVESSKNNQVTRLKIVIANSILYQFGVMLPKDEKLSDDAQKYFDSFEIQSK
jgi:hypothetical protein